jgi:nucleotide-binding universal stress UspA family protein
MTEREAIERMGSMKFSSICYIHCDNEGDEIAFEKALKLACEMEAKLDIIAVTEDVPATLLERLVTLGTEPEDLTGEQALLGRLSQLSSVAAGQGVEVTFEVLKGSPFSQIVERVATRGHDLVIKPTEPVNFMRQVFFGHLDRQLIRRCGCPVWIENPAKWSERGRILAAVDPSPYAEDREALPERESLNVAILETAVRIAEVFAAELHIVHVWSHPLESKLRGHVELSDDAIDAYGESIKHDHQRAFTELVAPYMDQITGVRILKGHAGEQIARLATEEEIDVIVMGTVCRTGIAGMLIGNTAETVLDQVTCSVVALKPSSQGN